MKPILSDGTVSGTVNGPDCDPGETMVVAKHRSDMSADNRIDIAGGDIVNGQFVADWTGQGPEGGPAETVRGMEGQFLGEFYGPGSGGGRRRR